VLKFQNTVNGALWYHASKRCRPSTNVFWWRASRDGFRNPRATSFIVAANAAAALAH
jgi:hypothetical protein